MAQLLARYQSAMLEHPRHGLGLARFPAAKVLVEGCAIFEHVTHVPHIAHIAHLLESRAVQEYLNTKLMNNY